MELSETGRINGEIFEMLNLTDIRIKLTALRKRAYLSVARWAIRVIDRVEEMKEKSGRILPALYMVCAGVGVGIAFSLEKERAWADEV